jgi:hypothetical protein
MKCDEMSLIDRILGSLQPITIVMARPDMALAVFPEK